MKGAAHKRTNIVIFHLWKMSIMDKFTETERWLVVGEEEPGGTATVHWASFWAGDKLLILHCGDGCTVQWMYHDTSNGVLQISELYTLNRWIVWYVNYIAIKLFKKILYTAWPLQKHSEMQKSYFIILPAFRGGSREAVHGRKVCFTSTCVPGPTYHNGRCSFSHRDGQ